MSESVGALFISQNEISCKKICNLFTHRAQRSSKELVQKSLCIPGFYCQNFAMLVFEERGKLDYLEKNLLELSREPTTNSVTYAAGSENRTLDTLVSSLLPRKEEGALLTSPTPSLFIQTVQTKRAEITY